jgi:uncharacterized DUF497 family protein
VRIDDFVWLPDVVDKIIAKHNVTPEEAEEVFAHEPHIRFRERGKVEGENLYRAFGQTNGGRYLTVFFLSKRDHSVLIITARDMDAKERREYAKNR